VWVWVWVWVWVCGWVNMRLGRSTMHICAAYLGTLCVYAFHQ
jgi:hypothetical protein